MTPKDELKLFSKNGPNFCRGMTPPFQKENHFDAKICIKIYSHTRVGIRDRRFKDNVVSGQPPSLRAHSTVYNFIDIRD